jgi:predicted metal-binding transcription factor (methanogenesis marker protein 9)
MERILNKVKNNKEAEKWNILQQIKMSPEERMNVAKELKKKFYGNNPPDVRRIKK